MMIKIRDDLFLAADSVTGIEIDTYDRITVAANGHLHSMHADYSKSAGETVRRINAEINAARGAVEQKLDIIINLLQAQATLAEAINWEKKHA